MLQGICKYNGIGMRHDTLSRSRDNHPSASRYSPKALKFETSVQIQQLKGEVIQRRPDILF